MRISSRAIAAFATAGLAVLGVAACGAESEQQTPSTATGFNAYLSCMAEHGVTIAMPSGGPGQGGGGTGNRPSFDPSNRPSSGVRPSGDPSFRPGGGGGGFGGGGFGNQRPEGVDEQTWTQAQEACSSVLPTGGPGGPGGPGAGGTNDSALTAYRNCLADRGVTMNGGADQLNTAEPAVAAAMTACAPLRPDTTPQPSAGS